LKKFSITLIRGGGRNDLPFVLNTNIRGVYDFLGIQKKYRKSIYASKKSIYEK
jgi:ribosomal protein S12